MLDQNELDTALVAWPRRFRESACGIIIRAKLLFENDVSFEKCLVLSECVVDMSGWDVQAFVFE